MSLRPAFMAAILTVASVVALGQPIMGPANDPAVSGKAPIILAQLLEAPSDTLSADDLGTPESAAPDDAPERTPAAAKASAGENDPASDSEFVFAADLARTLRKIDPDAKVDWDGKKLKVSVNGENFAIFPTGKEMVVNGNVEAGASPLKIRNGEIYVPQKAVSRIGEELEKRLATTPVTGQTTAPIATPIVSVTPTPEITPEASILPDAPPVVTPTTAITPVSVLPDVTPAMVTPNTSATPKPVTASTPEAGTAASATPFPSATPTPTPAPTPTPSPTPKVVEVEKKDQPAVRQSTLSTESFKAALRDKVSISTRDITLYNSTQLSEMAAARSVEKVLIYADEGGYERADEYGKPASRLALEIANRVKTKLDEAGIQAELVRDSEEPVTAGEGLEAITKSKAQALLVISVGYSTAFKDLGGYRIFFMNETVDYNTLRQRTFDGTEAVPSELNYKPFQNSSKVLASSLKNSIHEALDRDPIGMNPVPHYLVRRAPMAAASVVVGYLSNPADAKRLTDDTEQDAMAQALVEGIKNYSLQVKAGKTTGDNAGDL